MKLKTAVGTNSAAPSTGLLHIKNKNRIIRDYCVICVSSSDKGKEDDTGNNKEGVAYFYHNLSRRRTRPSIGGSARSPLYVSWVPRTCSPTSTTASVIRCSYLLTPSALLQLILLLHSSAVVYRTYSRGWLSPALFPGAWPARPL